MKKKVLAMFLAVIMAAAMLPTAFAADEDSKPGVTVNVKDLEALRIEGTTFRLRDWDPSGWDEEEEVLIFTKGEPVDHTSESLDAHELPLGITLTINGPDLSGQGSLNANYVSVNAWSDPDGDGIYDDRIFVETSETSELLPASEEGPVKAYFRCAHNFEVIDGSAPKIAHVDGHMWTIPTTFQVTSDYLTEYFGAHTLIQINVLTEQETGTYADYYFLLTGEQADPDLVGEPTDPTEPETPTFTDVPDWAAVEVSWGAGKGIVQGIGEGLLGAFRDCTHIEILTFLWRAAGSPAAAPAPVASGYDIEDFQSAINWAYEEGIINGSFVPSDPCNRASAVKYIWQALGSESAPASGFPDVDVNADYAPAVDWALDKGVTTGTGDGSVFSPDNICTRAEIITFLYRAYTD